MAYTDREDLNLLGQLMLIGANQTPFLNMMGGLAGGQFKTTTAFTFPLAQTYVLANASQPAITEADSVTSNTATTVTRTQDYNTVQIFQKTVEISHAKQSTVGEIGGISVEGTQTVRDEFGFQKDTQMKQLAIDLEYTFLNGSYQLGSDASTAAKTRGIIEAIVTNVVAASSADVSKAIMDSLFRAMATTGAKFESIVLFCNAFQKQGLSDIYAYAPVDRKVGGVAIETILTDFGQVGVKFDPQVPTDTIVAIEVPDCSPIYCPVTGQLLIFEDLAQVAASKKGEWYGQIGLDYGAEENHGKVTGLSTS